MTSPKDLRIGNYVMDKVSGEWMIVEDLTVKNIGAALINRSMYPLPDGWKMVYIPLSPEVLDKLGFTKAVALKGWWTEDMEITELKPGEYGLVVHSEYNEGEPIKYVHELQNIYRDLYKKDLELKPQPNNLVSSMKELSPYEQILQHIEMVIETPFVTTRFGSNWRMNAEKHYTKEMLIDVAWRNGRRVVLLEKYLKDLLEAPKNEH